MTFFPTPGAPVAYVPDAPLLPMDATTTMPAWIEVTAMISVPGRGTSVAAAAA